MQRRCLLTAAAVAAVGACGQTPGTHFKFDFGPGKTEAGCVRVLPSDVYSEDRGYGFEPGSVVQGVDRGGRDRLRGDFITSDKPPFYFSVRVPEEGNYRVRVVFGDRQGESVTTVKAELRRLMVEKAATTRGKFETREFIVNVRRPQIPTGGEVRLKDREKTFEAWAWDDKLTLGFTNRQPAVCGVEIMKADKLPTVFIVGDSTSTDQPREPFNSWGQMLTRFFKADIGVANHGESGESLRGFPGERRWAKVMSVIRRGDYVLIQMGHNDQKEKGEGVGAAPVVVSAWR